jgi:formyltetrahydrofolate deformylase
MVILIQCKDRVGVVADVAGILAKHNANIIAMKEHVDTVNRRFFARIVTEGILEALPLVNELKKRLPEGAEVVINPSAEKKIIILVTKEYHCLSDILVRNHFNSLGAQVQCVIGNHSLLNDVCERFGIPFYCVLNKEHNKEKFEDELLSVISKYKPNYLVLAKFMQILSPSFVEKFVHAIINIHHSFLPAFTGASPYRQAYERGVKLIGATAHFVTNDLDEGPIIAQQIIPVNHSFTVTDMIKAGKEIETAVLAKAMQLVFEERVLIYNNKTIIFE